MLFLLNCDDMFVVCLYVNVATEYRDLSHLPNLKLSVEICRNDSYQRSGENNKNKHRKTAFSGVDLLSFYLIQYKHTHTHTHTHIHTHTYTHTYTHTHTHTYTHTHTHTHTNTHTHTHTHTHMINRMIVNLL